jgi:hypothetical protein
MMSVSREHGAFSSFQLELELKARKGSVLHAQARCWYEHANGRLIRAAVRAKSCLSDDGMWNIHFNTVLLATLDERDYIIRG